MYNFGNHIENLWAQRKEKSWSITANTSKKQYYGDVLEVSGYFDYILLLDESQTKNYLKLSSIESIRIYSKE